MVRNDDSWFGGHGVLLVFGWTAFKAIVSVAKHVPHPRDDLWKMGEAVMPQR